MSNPYQPRLAKGPKVAAPRQQRGATAPRQLARATALPKRATTFLAPKSQSQKAAAAAPRTSGGAGFVIRTVGQQTIAIVDPSFEKVDVSGKAIDVVEFAFNRGVSRLKVLKLSHNKLINLPKGLGEMARGLVELDVSHNNLRVTALSKLLTLSNLTILHLKNNPSIPLELISNIHAAFGGAAMPLVLFYGLLELCMAENPSAEAQKALMEMPEPKIRLHCHK